MRNGCPIQNGAKNANDPTANGPRKDGFPSPGRRSPAIVIAASKRESQPRNLGAVRGLFGIVLINGIRIAGLAIASGIAIAGAALGTARVQAAVGASGTGAMAEKPEMWTYVLVLFAVPETLVVFGFVVGILLITRI